MFIAPDLKLKAPSVFRTADEGARVGASKHYTFIPTIQVIEDMAKLGWDVFDVSQQKSKVNPETTKHMVRFRSDEFGEVCGNIPEILLTSSHDRTKSMGLHAAIFRTICSNGLVICDKSFAKLNIRHMGYTFENVRDLIKQVTTNLPLVFNTIEDFEKTILSEKAKIDFAVNAYAIRYPENIKKSTGKLDIATITSKVSIPELLLPSRLADKENNLWCTYNVVQEKLMKGNFNHIGEEGKTRSARPLKNISLGVEFNKQLWELATKYLN